jgi:hypothetical protein
MSKDIVEVWPLDDYRLRLRFEDGVEGVIDVAKMVRFQGVFAPLQDRARFLEVRVDREIGTIAWPNGADFDPDVLYACITGEAIPQFEAKSTAL